jgi:hypothetical protein
VTAHASEEHAAIPGSLQRGADAPHDARGRRRLRRGLARRVHAPRRAQPHPTTGRVGARGRVDVRAHRHRSTPGPFGAQGVGPSAQLERHDHALVERVAHQAVERGDDVDDEEAGPRARAHHDRRPRARSRTDERHDGRATSPAAFSATDHVHDRDPPPDDDDHDHDHHHDDGAATAATSPAADVTATDGDTTRDLTRRGVSSRS